MIRKQTLAVIGGGAAGFFAAISAAEQCPNLSVVILEQGPEVLGKVKISGGGRCNVTHACYEVRELLKFYPRGNKELSGPFHRFSCADTIQWFENRGIELKTEEDGRMFPVTDKSQTIVDCLAGTALELGIRVIKRAKVRKVTKADRFHIHFNDEELLADYLLFATGSNPSAWQQLEQLGHSLVPAVPSLFTFNIKHPLIHGLAGISLPEAEVKISGTKFEAKGPVLITHWGLSGPGILKLSAFAARELAQWNYTFSIQLNWISETPESAKANLADLKMTQAKKQLGNYAPFHIPNRFWKSLLAYLKIDENKKYADLNKDEIKRIAGVLTEETLKVYSKSTNKDEFVTAGGVTLKEVDFKTMESKIVPGLFLAGEVLDIDALTGGFNFQAAWTTGYIAGSSIAERACS